MYYDSEMLWNIDNYMAERDIARKEAEENGEEWTDEKDTTV